ncbi:MAG: pyruvate kinase [bacterium]|nr:MAG: pyruvate kinase [bacterium]
MTRPRRARIICTLGPATRSQGMLERLIGAGMDVARLNMAYGTQEDHRDHIRALRAGSLKLGQPVAVLLDLQGIKIRIGQVKGESLHLESGRDINLRPGRRPSTADCLYVSYPALLRDVRVGHRVLLDDGLLCLVVTGREGNALTARVKEGGVLISRKGVNLPYSAVSARPFTSKDRGDLAFGIREGVDAVALSFVTRPGDVDLVRRELRRMGSHIPVIAKIEKPSAVSMIEDILDRADGIMVARGDLAVESSPFTVPLTQKLLIREANRKQRLVITATQMLDSMRYNPVPTRAETADVANAILDGSDAVMLSGETSVGKDPVRAVRMMARIVTETEQGGASFRVGLPTPEPVREGDLDRTGFAVADAAVSAARDVGARCIVAFTRSGYTAAVLAKFRPPMPIVAFTSEPTIIRRMKLLWGVVPLPMDHLEDTDTMVTRVEKALLEGGYARRGDDVVITASLPMGTRGKTNFLKVHRMAGRPAPGRR